MSYMTSLIMTIWNCFWDMSFMTWLLRLEGRPKLTLRYELFDIFDIVESGIKYHNPLY
jgi:hypothetical protein